MPPIMVLVQAENGPVDDDTATAGGAISSPDVEVDTSSPGELLARMDIQPSGDIDVDHETQYQVGYVKNKASAGAGNSLGSGGVYIKNCLQLPSTTQRITLQSNSASDDSSKFVRLWGESSGGALITEDVTLDGTTAVHSVGSFVRLFRSELLLVSTGLPTTAAGIIDVIEFGASSIGEISQGYSYATREFAIAMAAAIGDVGTWSNRKTSPGAFTWTYNHTEAGRLLFPATIGPGQYCAVYWRNIFQPGMPSADLIPAFRCFGSDV